MIIVNSRFSINRNKLSSRKNKSWTYGKCMSYEACCKSEIFRNKKSGKLVLFGSSAWAHILTKKGLSSIDPLHICKNNLLLKRKVMTWFLFPANEWRSSKKTSVSARDTPNQSFNKSKPHQLLTSRPDNHNSSILVLLFSLYTNSSKNNECQAKTP